MASIKCNMSLHISHPFLDITFSFAPFPVKKSITSQDLQAHARDLLGLLPAFCNLPTDICQKFGSLAEVLVTFLKDSLMHENIAVALQVISPSQ